LTDEVMQRLNYEVSGKRREPAEVARAFLVEAGILKE
jgi:osmoprotectant transport system substrate-binding protein